MGQVIEVEVAESNEAGIRQFVLNRGLTGMDVSEYASAADAISDKPDDRLARALFALGVSHVAIYGSVVTVQASGWEALTPKVVEAIRNLFVNYDVNRV